jgi:type II secretory pathway component PulK
MGNARRGSTLVTVTILVGTMTVLTLLSLRVSQRIEQEQVTVLEAARAKNLAEAGISEAIVCPARRRSGRHRQRGGSGLPRQRGRVGRRHRSRQQPRAESTPSP